MRLSKKGWNNVLIFSVLLIVFIFNFKHKLSLKPQVLLRTVISGQHTIVEIKTPDFKLIRNGRQWAAEPSLGLSEIQLAQLAKNWQNLPLDTLQDVFIDNTAPYYVQVYIASEAQPIVVQLDQYKSDYLLHIEDDITLLLPAHKLPLFFGR